MSSSRSTKLVAVHLDGLPRVLAEQHALADLQIGHDALAVRILAAGADGDHFTLVGLFRRAVGDHDARCGGGFLVESFHDHAVVQGA